MFEVNILDESGLQNLLCSKEDHFSDIKSKDIKPAKLQESFVAFANADGGELYVGIEDEKYNGNRIRPFINPEEANAIINVLLEETNPTVEGIGVEYLQIEAGFILHISIPKSPKVHYTSSGDCYIRLNANKNKIKGDRITSLAYSKGIMAYERQPVANADIAEILDSRILAEYIQRVSTNLAPEKFLKKQRLISRKSNDNNSEVPNVGCVILFDEEPQATLDTRCAIKVYRLLTTDSEYKREHLLEMPTTINGSLEILISNAIKEVKRYLDGAKLYDGSRMEYPAEAIKEVLVNAVIHRDYSLNDDIHIKIYDDRIEVISPGKLPGYMTLSNLYEERFSRNPNLVRMLHNLPEPLNHDIGEGLDTVKNELRKAGLVEPQFEEKENSFIVTMKHKRLASIESVIIEYLTQNPDKSITNLLVRQLTGENDVNKIKGVLKRLRNQNKICVIGNPSSAFEYEYKLVD
ncbi:ATP-binding protein [Acinetobacter baumannii]|uniref:ATP-binding protein n=1 Tax=Acinetobacter baumannii TaxID=470 RepID=UPI0013C6557B|nr:ATP-binding protein [Acinetobacter baumannii]EHU3266318.1 putative DNA binding domain-containing protein [Acinetobacter baumannii]NDW24845.1 transcriptional regulator [Acinetobacter baumannii]HBM1135021.1 putative DNA binding domain-containing protein [Acinetobacter baumannii]